MNHRSKFYRLLNKYVLSKIGDSPLAIRAKWKAALILVGTEFHEQNIGAQFEKTLKWFDAKLCLQDELAVLIPGNTMGAVRILDVGAGPISKVGKIYNQQRIELEAIDPLAKRYKKILMKNNLVPPVWTRQGSGESLTKLFEENAFDLIHARNCLDHTSEPFAIIQQMLEVVKPGCFIYLNHFLNEGERSNYFGLHQWNFQYLDNCFVISNRSGSISIDLNAKLQGVAKVFTSVQNGRVITTIQKIGKLCQ